MKKLSTKARTNKSEEMLPEYKFDYNKAKPNRFAGRISKERVVVLLDPEVKYYVNKNAQANGDHEVHVPTCSFFPEPENRIFLGEFSSCGLAVREAKKHYSQSNGCYYCCNERHTS